MAYDRMEVTMNIFTYNMDLKIGPVENLGLKRLTPGLPERTGPRLLIYHGQPGPAANIHLSDFDWIICISSLPCEPPLVRENGRLRGIDWSMEDLKDLNRHPEWKQKRLRQFLETTLRSDVEPQWDIMAAPKAPEHVIACYLCSLSNISPQNDWRMGFEEEVGYWTTEKHDVPNLDWNSHSTEIARLRQFLVAVSALKTHTEGR